MSSVIHTTESIYNLIPKKYVKTEKAPRYVSTFRDQVKLEKQKNKAFSKTMGPAKVEMASPDKYLLKHSKEPKLPEKKPFSYRYDIRPKKPEIPARTKQSLTDIHTKRNFVTSNVLENTVAVPRKPEPAHIYTRNGDKELLKNSGLVPNYVKKKDYGQIPEYLSQRQENIRRAQENRHMKERMREASMKQLTKEKRKEVLDGLKKNWDELHHQYQGLSVITDTLRKKNRKETLESKMMQLEKDIKMVEGFKTIYITKN